MGFPLATLQEDMRDILRDPFTAAPAMVAPLRRQLSPFEELFRRCESTQPEEHDQCNSRVELRDIG
jgi:hypothetical protein